jgi:hypothetical protein
MASRAPSTPSAARTPRAAPNAPRKLSLDDIDRALEAHITDAETTFTGKNVTVTLAPGFPHFRAYQLFTQLTDLVPAASPAPVRVPYRKGVSYRQASRAGLYDEAHNLIVPNSGSTFSLQGNGVSVTLAAGMPFAETYDLFEELMKLAPPPPPVFYPARTRKLCRNGDVCRYAATGTCNFAHPVLVPPPPPPRSYLDKVEILKLAQSNVLIAVEKLNRIRANFGSYSEAYVNAYAFVDTLRQDYNEMISSSLREVIPGWPSPPTPIPPVRPEPFAGLF